MKFRKSEQQTTPAAFTVPNVNDVEAVRVEIEKLGRINSQIKKAQATMDEANSDAAKAAMVADAVDVDKLLDGLEAGHGAVEVASRRQEIARSYRGASAALALLLPARSEQEVIVHEAKRRAGRSVYQEVRADWLALLRRRLQAAIELARLERQVLEVHYLMGQSGLAVADHPAKLPGLDPRLDSAAVSRAILHGLEHGLLELGDVDGLAVPGSPMDQYMKAAAVTAKGRAA